MWDTAATSTSSYHTRVYTQGGSTSPSLSPSLSSLVSPGGPAGVHGGRAEAARGNDPCRAVGGAPVAEHLLGILEARRVVSDRFGGEV